MAFQLDIGGNDKKIMDPSPNLIRDCVQRIWDDDRDSFLILTDMDQDSFVQCAADYEEQDYFHLEYSPPGDQFYRADGLVSPEEVIQTLLDFRMGKAPDLDDGWLDVSEEMYGPI